MIDNNDSVDDNLVQVIDESLDVMSWALNRNDPENLFYTHDRKALPKMKRLVVSNVSPLFKYLKNAYHRMSS